MNKWDNIYKSNPSYKPLNELFLSDLFKKIKDEVNPNPKTVLDIGCGTADTLFQFYQLGLKVSGIDFSKTAINIIQKKIDENNQDINVSFQDLNITPIQKSADIYFCNFVYSFIEKKKFFLENLKEAMKTNSVFILVTPVTRKGVSYQPEDKPGIAVDYEGSISLLRKYFTSVEDYHHDYIGKRQDYVTFFIKK